MGDAVAEDDVVAEIETDKTSVPVPSPGNGVIEELLVADGTTVKAGQPIFKINITGLYLLFIKSNPIRSHRYYLSNLNFLYF